MNNSKAIKVFVLFGPPGSGKGTQAEKLIQQYPVKHVATGDLFRENIKNSTELGRTAKQFIDRGELVPDSITIDMLKARLNQKDGEAFLLDGFPRTIPQAEALSGMLTQLGMKLTSVLSISLVDDEIVRRLSERYICRKCQTPYNLSGKKPKQAGICDYCGGELYQRSDDQPATVRARLGTFHAQTKPLLDYYRKLGLLREFDSFDGWQKVNKEINAIMPGLLAD